LTDLNDLNDKKLLEEEVINSLLNNNEYFANTMPYLTEKYFSESGNKIIFEKIKDFYLDYGKKPNIKDVILLLKDEVKSKKEVAVQS
jgi:replicative DNA helicase